MRIIIILSVNILVENLKYRYLDYINAFIHFIFITVMHNTQILLSYSEKDKLLSTRGILQTSGFIFSTRISYLFRVVY